MICHALSLLVTALERRRVPGGPCLLPLSLEGQLCCIVEGSKTTYLDRYSSHAETTAKTCTLRNLTEGRPRTWSFSLLIFGSSRKQQIRHTYHDWC